MSSPSLPNFERTLQLSQGNLDSAELAECHGLLCGLASCNSGCTAGDYLSHLSAMQLLVDPGAALAEVMVEAWENTVRQMEDEEFGFELWLPDDDELLEERAISLAQWCSGFLAGLGSACQLEALSDDAREALSDLMDISRAEVSPEDGGPEGSEEDEAAYAEIVEYVRVVALTLREEFRGPGRDDAIH
jgi:yecA family protein